MSPLRHLQHRAWEQLAEGWRHVAERAGNALTYFQPVQEGIENQGGLVERHALRWGVLPAEVREEHDRLVVKLEIPGLDPEQIHVDVVDKGLVIAGEKRVPREEARGRYHLLECAYGRFERLIPLPMAVDPLRTRAHYHHGVLTIILLKANRSPTKAKTV